LRGKEQESDAPSLDELGGPLLSPPILVLDALGIIELSASLALLAKNGNANSTAFKVARSQWSNSTEPAGAEVDSMRGGFGEVGGLEPVKREYERLIAKRARERRRNFA
jgi:hypothetical protein